MNTRAGREESIRWMHSLGQSVNLFEGTLSKENEEEIKTRVYDLANWFYNIEPARTDLEGKIQGAKTIEELNALKEDVVRSDSVSIFNLWNDMKIKLS